MGSIAQSLYGDQRAACYTCNDSSSGNVKVRGDNMKLECRKYTDVGNMAETKYSAMETDLFETNLIDIVPIGVDNAKMTWGKKFKFKTQSRGAGGYDRYQCKEDYQIPELIKHDKLLFTELLYVNYKGCPKQFISTELQGMVYKNDRFSDSYDVDNELSDALVLAARETVSEQVQYCDIVGIFKGANEKANAYDGILAQAYWAYTGIAYYNSIEFTIDETELIDGTFVHCKYSGLTIDIAYDSTEDTDSDIERYKTRAEVYERIVDWLNNEVLASGGRKYVDATFIGNKIIVTSKWTETTVNLQMHIDGNEKVENWFECAEFKGVTYKTLQGVMPVDERPVLVEYRKYNASTIVKDLPNDIHLAEMEIDTTLMQGDQKLSLYIDKYLYKTYTNALKTRDRDVTSYNLEDDYDVYILDALSEHGGTGIWFLTVSSTTEENRNVAHLIDTERRDVDDIYVGLMDQSGDNMKLKYEVLHGVTCKDWRLFASNLLNSPFSKSLHVPHESTIKMLPCFNPKVRSSMKENSLDGCKIRAGFKMVDKYENEAMYSLNGQLGYLQAGESMPEGAKAVIEIKFKDYTSGIPSTELGNVTYKYTFTTNDGVEFISNDKDPVFRFEKGASISFNVTQEVTLSNGCKDDFDASNHFQDDYPFVAKGECDDIDISIGGNIANSDGQYQIIFSDASSFDEGDGIKTVEVFVYEQGASKPATPTFEELSDSYVNVSDFASNGWVVEIDITSELGCTFNVSANVDGPIAVGENTGFSLTNS